ncbi:MAG: hypothetical protein JNM30_02775 [Rhodospirillales bacterium]|nr:hypothetical protein [Rhodospirillales bacterium]
MPEEPRPPTDGGAVQRQRGFFGRRSVLESSGAVKPSEPPNPPQPEAAPEPETPPPNTKAGRKAARKAAARKAMAERGPEAEMRSRRRTGKVGLVLLGAAAIGVAGAWTADRWMQPRCDPAIDPTCQQAKSSASSGGGTSASRSSSRPSSTRSGSRGSWFSWGDSDGGSSAIAGGSGAATVFGTTRRVEQSTIRRGGFGSVGRFFSSGG